MRVRSTALLTCSLLLVAGCYETPGDAVAGKLKDAAFGSDNDKACDAAGDITRDVTKQIEQVTAGDFEGLSAQVDEGATAMRRLAGDAEGEVKRSLTAVGDAYRDLASSIRVRDGAGAQRAQGSIETATKALAAACDGKTQEG